MGVSDGWYAFDNDINAILEALKGTFVESGGLVKQHGTPQMKVIMEVVVYFVNGTRVSKVETEVVITAADGSQPRKDIIVGDSAGNITAVAGTKNTAMPTGSTGPQTYNPKPPNIPANKALLAEVWVEVSETTILDADITDRRVFQAAEYTRELFIPVGPKLELDGWIAQEFGYSAVHEMADNQDKAVHSNFLVPNDYVSFVDVKVVWMSPAGAGNLSWELQATWQADEEALGAHVEATGEDVVATSGADNMNIDSHPTPLTLSGLAYGDILNLRFCNYSESGGHTLNDVVYFMGFIFRYKARRWL